MFAVLAARFGYELKNARTVYRLSFTTVLWE